MRSIYTKLYITVIEVTRTINEHGHFSTIQYMYCRAQSSDTGPSAHVIQEELTLHHDMIGRSTRSIYGARGEAKQGCGSGSVV